MKKFSAWGLAGILTLSSGCTVFRNIDKGLTHFADVLAERQKTHEEAQPEYLLRKQGYLLHQGSLTVPPIQLSIVTNVVQHITFSYTSPETIDDLYLTLSREFRVLLGGTYHEERQRVFPAGFLSTTNADNSLTYSYTFTSDMLREKGRYHYSWWRGVPPEQDPNLFESIADLFTRDDAQILLEGVYDQK